LARRYSEAVEALHRIANLDINQRALLTAAHAQLGNDESARESAQKLLDCEPNFRVATHLAALYFKNQSDRDHYGQALRNAGLPE
jgi:tetratricopeptide (TPR) repeat protein